MKIWKNKDIKSCNYGIQNSSTQTLCSLKHSYCRIFQNLLLFLSPSRTRYWMIMTFLIVLDAAEWGICEANRIFNSCDFSVGPVLYIRVQFNEPGKYWKTFVIADDQLQFSLRWSFGGEVNIIVGIILRLYHFIFLSFLFITSSDCSLEVVKLLARIRTQLIHGVINVIFRLFHDATNNVVFTKRRTQLKNKWLRIWKQEVLTYFKLLTLQSPDKTREDQGSFQWR
jgi:hypothetical protein